MPEKRFGLRWVAKPGIGTPLIGDLELNQFGAFGQTEAGIECTVVHLDITKKLIRLCKPWCNRQLRINRSLHGASTCLERVTVQVVLRCNDPLQKHLLITISNHI